MEGKVLMVIWTIVINASIDHRNSPSVTQTNNVVEASFCEQFKQAEHPLKVPTDRKQRPISYATVTVECHPMK